MRSREPFVRKHICIFEVTRSIWECDTRILVERTCGDCDRVQHGHVNQKEWPEALWALVDADWKDGAIA